MNQLNQSAHALSTCTAERTSKMVSYWRQAGLNYLQYSNICARLVRRCLKADLRVEALKKEESTIKAVKWEGGKPSGEIKQYSATAS